MSGFTGWARALIVAGGALTVAACGSYPTEPRYSTHPTPLGGQPAPQGTAGQYPGQYPGQPPTPYEAPPPSRAPIESIEGGALPPPAATSSYDPSSSGAPAYDPPPAARPSVSGGGVAYVIQPGDTISGVGRRFQTPVQTLIDLNALGPRGGISAGQRIILPESAVDTGSDPFAVGPAPIGVIVPEAAAPPPPPPPPPASFPAPGNAGLPPPARQPAPIPVPGAAPNVAGIALQWPVRGDIVRRFGPVGMGERNNGVNIGASAGEAVSAAASGRVAYVGDDLVGQGLTVLIVHRDGWRTVYGHLGSATVDDGADVRAGQQIGTVGLTAGDGRPSIHFETRRMQGDEPVAIDPLTVLPR